MSIYNPPMIVSGNLYALRFDESQLPPQNLEMGRPSKKRKLAPKTKPQN